MLAAESRIGFAVTAVHNDDWTQRERFIAALTPAELEIMCSYRNPRRRLEWLAGRQAAKTAVKRLLRRDCDLAVEILRAASGAPYVNDQPGICVSISHSGALAAAVAALFPIGIDIEQIEPRPDALIKMCFNSAEQAHLACLPGTLKVKVQNRIWTYKEAVAKLLKAGGRLSFREICALDRQGFPGTAGPGIAVHSSVTDHYAVTVVYNTGEYRGYGRN